MAEEPKAAAAESAHAVSATLSQLVARILNQLSLSSWLPAAALTLLIGFTLELASSLGVRRKGSTTTLAASPDDALSYTFQSIGKLSIGSLILLVIVIVVVTMLTQAFAFGAIRFMEGYWGINRFVESLASWKCRRQLGRYDRIDGRRNAVRLQAWSAVAAQIEAEQQLLVGNNKPRVYTIDMIKAIGARAMGTHVDVRLTRRQKTLVDAYEWASEAPGDLLRRQLNFDIKLDDYPDDLQHVMPTRFGNVLRKYEDDTGQNPVEGFVEEVYDSLPFSMQMDHDEQRARLDLYCSMIFVLWLFAAFSAARFGQHWMYTVAVVALCLIGTRVTYRAAIASARHYGHLLVTIAEHVAAVAQVAEPDPVSSSGSPVSP